MAPEEKCEWGGGREERRGIIKSLFSPNCTCQTGTGPLHNVSPGMISSPYCQMAGSEGPGRLRKDYVT